MVIMTASQKTESKGQEIITKKHIKHHYKTRPITATLDHPLILDIKLLKKLDMTTFTKKGLIALSKFCGISLINKTETKKKLNKCVKTIQYSKKQLGQLGSDFSVDNSTTGGFETNRNSNRNKRKIGKQMSKSKPRIRFKLTKEESSPDEDSLDVVCKKHNIIKYNDNNSGMNRKSLINNIINDRIENIIPEPCKTCCRSEQPERFHSHPKMLMRLSLEENKNMKKNIEGRGCEEGKKSLCANQDKQLSEEQQPEKKIPEKINSSKPSLKSPTKSNSSTELSSPEGGNKSKSKNTRKLLTLPSSSSSSSASGKPKSDILKKSNSKIEMSQSEEAKDISGEEDMKFVTGCYVCGKQISPKLRLKHEKTCILEWRTQNSLISPDKRKPEPKRPDYRFTASGDLDCEGTFESIWANHMDSLVPCKKCGRKFFPDRIERHENCCNNVPVNIKYKH